jgi:hypothetical protein
MTRLKWREGRFWCHYGSRHEFKVNWRVFSRRIGFGLSLYFEIEDGNEVTANVSIPWLATVYVTHTVPRRWLERILPEHHFRHSIGHGDVMEGSYHLDRRIGVNAIGDWFQWQFWAHPNGGYHGLSNHPPLPWYRQFSFFWYGVLFGRSQYTEEVITEPHLVQIPMPEGCYPAWLRVVRRTWKRPRSLFKRTRITHDIDCDVGVPFPGKGENSWDCGEDCLHAAGYAVDTDEQAVKRFADRVRDRNWNT